MVASPANPTVLIIMPLAEQRGGAELALLQLIRRETSVHWHVVFLNDGPMVEQTRALGVGADVIPAGRVRQPMMVLKTVRAIARVAREINASAMLGWMAKAHLYGGLAAKLARIPAVWFQHGLPSTDSWIDSLVNRIPAAGSLACSEFVADAQRRVTPHLPVRVVHPATDLENFDPPTLPTPAACREQLKTARRWTSYRYLWPTSDLERNARFDRCVPGDPRKISVRDCCCCRRSLGA